MSTSNPESHGKKRKHDTKHDTTNNATSPAKKQKKGFSVGPDNLPDGTHRRKVQKIKRSLIEGAKLRKEYAKLKKHNDLDLNEAERDQLRKDSKVEMHPERQTMLDDSADGSQEAQQHIPDDRSHDSPEKRRRKQRTNPFAKEIRQAEQRKAEAEARRKAIAEAQAERQKKLEDRERFRKAMAKAKAVGPNGQRKLGRESKILLERVQRLVGS